MKNKSKWENYKYKIYGNIITDNIIEESINSLKYYLNSFNFNGNQTIIIQFKINYNDNSIRSISYLQTIKISDMNILIDIFKEFWDIKGKEYNELNIKMLDILYTYKIIDNIENRLVYSEESNIENNSNFKKLDRFRINNIDLPNTMDLTSWKKGEIIFSEDYKNAEIKKNEKTKYKINILDNFYKVEVIINDSIILTFKDEILDKNNLNSFIRTVKNREYIYINGEIILKTIERKNKYLKIKSRDLITSTKFLTMDIETKVYEKKMEAICISIYDGENIKSIFKSDNLTSEDIIKNAIKYILSPKYNKYIVYIHNFSYFDSVFILKILTELNLNMGVIIRNNKFIDLKIKYGKSHVIWFRDSYLILQSSLKKLSESFKVDSKSIFPFNFLNLSYIDLNYSGKVPDKIYFGNLTMEEYKKYYDYYINKQMNIGLGEAESEEGNIWNLKRELIKYCEQDVVSLYQVIDKFRLEIWEKYRNDINKYPTLPSLALSIFKSNYLKKEINIPLIHNNMYKEISEAYFGGNVDVYKTYGENIYIYDINSLYPYIMKNCLMPVDNPVYFEGDITIKDKNAFGFFEVDINTPLHMNIPILPVKKGLHTITPLGNWQGMYFSEELYNSKNYGYTYKILRGYTFNKKIIFEKYVDDLYKIKSSSSKYSSKYTISKLLLNGLYGRFGMNPYIEKHKIIPHLELKEYIKNYNIRNIINLSEDYILISYKNINYENIENENLDISISLAAAITSYARIYMYNIIKKLENLGYIIYYMDTDSIAIDKPLYASIVGKEIGLFKLEHIFEKAVFLSPKVYGGINKDYESVKVKGFKNPISFKLLLTLLDKNNSLLLNQEKWMRNYEKGSIEIVNELYRLMVTNNKRIPIFDNNNRFISTKPYII